MYTLLLRSQPHLQQDCVCMCLCTQMLCSLPFDAPQHPERLQCCLLLLRRCLVRDAPCAGHVFRLKPLLHERVMPSPSHFVCWLLWHILRARLSQANQRSQPHAFL